MTGTKVVRNSGQFQKGHAKTGGRRRGTPNKATRAAKEWMAAIISKLSVQDAIEKRILKGDTAAFFKAVEHVIGKPRQATDVNQASTVVFRWAGEEESRLEDGRKRVADAKRREDASPEQATPRRDDA